jgi:hypothetical protein
MWMDVIHGYINPVLIEYIEVVSKASKPIIVLHMVSGRAMDIEGDLARDILEYARMNKVQFTKKLFNPVGLNGETS